MNLDKLLKGIKTIKIYGDTNISLKGVADDSRKVEKGFVFVAIPGEKVNGHDFIAEVIANGALVVVGEREPEQKWLSKVTYVRVTNSRNALSYLSSNWYDNPSKKLKMIGVTGTDGKTTTSNIIYHILSKAGKKVAVISTISAKINNVEIETGLHVTNPEPLQLHQLLQKAVKEGCEYCVLEVTSHGLDQDRVSGINFEIGVLTNITHEHLDYHKTWDNYFKSKMKLFEKSDRWILNMDDESFEKITKQYPDKTVVSYSIVNDKSNLYASNIQSKDDSQIFDLNFKGQTFKCVTNLHGSYNISNILAALGACLEVGIDMDISLKAVSDIPRISGRYEEIKNDKGIRIVVDFAHTPNSLEKILTELKKSTKGKLIAVFGCAGLRDVEKRKLMPRISVKYANYSIFTAEDPRTEKVADILREMEKAVLETKNSNYELVEDRGEAILKAINMAKRDDTVVICGKGHEKSMCYGSIDYPWSDQEAVTLSLKGEAMKIKFK